MAELAGLAGNEGQGSGIRGQGSETRAGRMVFCLFEVDECGESVRVLVDVLAGKIAEGENVRLQADFSSRIRPIRSGLKV